MLDRLPPRVLLTARLPLKVQPPGDPVLPIRQLHADHLPAVAEVLVAAYSGTVDDLGETPEEALDYLHKRVAGGETGPMLWECSFVAMDGDAPVAAVLTSEEKPGQPLLGDVYTHPKWQGKGLATALIHATAEALLERGFDRVTLRVALANTGARRLYERLGFAE